MRVPTERIRERFAQFQKDGLKVLAALELNAGFKKPSSRAALKSNPCNEIPAQIGARERGIVEKNEQ